MIPPSPTIGSQASPISGNSFLPASGNSVATFLGKPQPAFSLAALDRATRPQDLAAMTEQLREMLADEPGLQARLDKVLEALSAREQGDAEAPAKLMEAISQLWQRQPQDPLIQEQVQQLLFALQKELATQPKSEPLIAQIRGMQETRAVPLRQGSTLTAGDLQTQAPHQLGKLANGAPLAPLQAQGLLTQPRTDSQLLALLSTAVLNGEQLSELSSLVQLRQTQPQLPAATGTLNQQMPGSGGHEFSPLTLGKQPTLWAEQMLAPLSDRLRVQSHLGVKQATLRLDPPELGKLDLQVRTEGDRVFIQVSATNPAVRDQLLQLTDRLRQEVLLGGGYAQVDVDIGQHGEQQHDADQFRQQEQEIAKSTDNHEGSASRSEAFSDHRVDTLV